MRPQLALVALVLAGCAGPGPPGEPAPYVLDGLGPSELLLWRTPYSGIVAEIDYVEGRRPDDATISGFAKELAELARKPVRIVGPDPIPGIGATSFTVRTTEELLALHRSTFASDPDPEALGGGSTAYVHVLFPDGVHERALAGVSIGHVFVVFKDGLTISAAVDARSDGVVERSVLRHEMGHTLGLVDCGLPMLTPRAKDGCHSSHEESVMYAATVQEAVGSLGEALIDFVVVGPAERMFDEADRLDIASYTVHEAARTS